MIYEHRKHSGELPIIGVNTFEEGVDNSLSVEEFDIEVTRSDKEERMMVIDRNKAFKETHAKEAEKGLARLKQVAREGGNLFEVMMDIVELHCWTSYTALFDTGGKFSRKCDSGIKLMLKFIREQNLSLSLQHNEMNFVGDNERFRN